MKAHFYKYIKKKIEMLGYKIKIDLDTYDIHDQIDIDAYDI